MKLLGKLLLNCYDSYKKVMDHNQNPLRHILILCLVFLDHDRFSMDVVHRFWSLFFKRNFNGCQFHWTLSYSFMVFFTASVFYDAEKNNDSWLIKL